MFYGHADIACSVVAACKVEGGPTYRLTLTGEASRVEYKFSKTVVDVGTQVCFYKLYLFCMFVCACMCACACVWMRERLKQSYS